MQMILSKIKTLRLNQKSKMQSALLFANHIQTDCRHEYYAFDDFLHKVADV